MNFATIKEKIVDFQLVNDEELPSHIIINAYDKDDLLVEYSALKHKTMLLFNNFGELYVDNVLIIGSKDVKKGKVICVMEMPQVQDVVHTIKEIIKLEHTTLSWKALQQKLAQHNILKAAEK